MQKFTGLQYLMIDVANNFGLDKESWKNRLAWFEEHKNHLDSLVKQAESPALFYGAIQAYYKALEGKPSGYPVSLDATASGLQILACLTGDRKAAELCNVVPVFGDDAEAKRIDGYTVVYERMLAKVGERSVIKRDDCKQAVMTSLYGSTAIPKEVFGEGILYKVFDDTMDESAPAVWELNKAYLAIWDPTKETNSWTLPDNGHVHVKVMDLDSETVHFLNQPVEIIRRVHRPTEEGRSLSANTTHSVDGMIVREMVRRCSYSNATVQRVWECIETDEYHEGTEADRTMVQILWNHYKESGYLSARIMDHLYSNNMSIVDVEVIRELLQSLPEKPFHVISVHDCFRCLPNYANDLREQYNRQLYLIAKSNLLGYILKQLLGREVSIGKLDPTLADDILTTEYALS